MKKYKQKDLGYKRTPTDAMLRVTFANGEIWDVPAQVVVDSRDEHYKDEEEDTASQPDHDYEITDWASNNMNWEDLSPYAKFVKQPPKVFDYEADWCNAEKAVVEGEPS